MMDVLEPGSMSSTNGGNPLSCRAALAAIEIIEEEKLAERSARIGERMLSRFREMQAEHPIIGDVRGMGLAIGIEIIRDLKSKEPASDLTKAIIDRAFRKGLMMIAPIGFHGNVIRIAPPLMIPDELADYGVEIIEKAIAEVVSSTRDAAART